MRSAGMPLRFQSENIMPSAQWPGLSGSGGSNASASARAGRSSELSVQLPQGKSWRARST